MPNSAPGTLWRSTPPAVFPPIMGLFGLGLAWRRAEGAFGTPSAIADLVLGVVSLCFLFFVVSYAGKFIFRPRVLLEDLRVLPGMAGLSAMSLSAMLMAAGVSPFAPVAAAATLIGALVVHLAIAGLALWQLLAGPAEGRVVSPVWHLVFVGFIIAPLAALPLEFDGLALLCFLATMPVAAAIYVMSAVQAVRRETPAPLRPLLAIHLAPLSLFGTVAALMGYQSIALGFAVVATALTALLLGRLRSLLAAGFSPFWGAFTFPLAAYASLLLLIEDQGDVATIAGGLVLAAATLAIPLIAARVLRVWSTGMLAARTNSAVA